jgi:hypothetical protein
MKINKTGLLFLTLIGSLGALAGCGESTDPLAAENEFAPTDTITLDTYGVPTFN